MADTALAPEPGTVQPAARQVPAGQSLLRRLATFQPETFDATQRTVQVVWTTGADVQRRDPWTGEAWVERLLVTSGACDLSRLNAGAPVLDSHQSWELANVVGVVERAWIEGGVGHAILRFSAREDIAPIVADVQAGIIRNISAGYWVDQWQTTEAGNGQPMIREAIRWTPGELSLVPVPADAGAQVRTAPSRSTPPAVLPVSQQQEVRMPDDIIPAGGQPAAEIETRAAPLATQPDPVADARREETERVRGITLAGRALGLAERADALIAEGVSLSLAQSRLITEAARSTGGQAAAAVRPAAHVIRDEGETALRGLGDALLHRAGLLRGADGLPMALPDHAREYRGQRLSDMAATCIQLRGGSTRGMTRAEIAQAAMGNRSMMSRADIGMHSTSDFPNLLANTASKAMGMGYGSARRTFTLWARQRVLPDFKSFTVVNLGGAPALSLVSGQVNSVSVATAAAGPEAGEVQYGTVAELGESYRLFRYGKQIAVTFEAIVNDDMDAFSRIPQMFGVAAARLESTTVYALLAANANMSDGNPLFDTTHVNVFGNGVAGYSAGDGLLNVTGLSKGRAAMRKQTAMNGDLIDVDPRWLLVPPDLEGVALQYTANSYVASAPGNLNPFASTLTPIVEPRLTGSAIQWYLMADNAVVDTVEYGYLEGLEAPQITSRYDDDTDGTIVKCTHNFGAKATDWRGMARSSGT